MTKPKSNGEDKSKAAQVELETFVPERMIVTSIHGEEVIVPKISWKKEIQLIKLIESVLNVLSDVDFADNMKVVERLLTVAPEKATKFISVILDKDEEWIENNLDMPEIVATIVPLLRQRLDLIVKRVAPYLAAANEDETNLNLEETMQALKSSGTTH